MGLLLLLLSEEEDELEEEEDELEEEDEDEDELSLSFSSELLSICFFFLDVDFESFFFFEATERSSCSSLSSSDGFTGDSPQAPKSRSPLMTSAERHKISRLCLLSSRNTARFSCLSRLRRLLLLLLL